MVLRCLLVDDNPDFLRTARNLLEREAVEVVGSAETGEQAVAEALALRPDVALVDLHLGEESGLELARQLLRRMGALAPRVILISTYAAGDLEELIAEDPALGFLAKDRLSGDSIRALVE